MKANFLSPEQKQAELKRMGEEARKNGAIPSAQVAKMLNDDLKKMPVKEEQQISINAKS